MEWFGAFGAIVAAALIAADLSRRITGWAFVLFVVVSAAWIISGVLSSTWPIVIQNALLLLVNAYGVWQFLLSPCKKREIDEQEKLAEQASKVVDAQEANAAA